MSKILNALLMDLVVEQTDLKSTHSTNSWNDCLNKIVTLSDMYEGWANKLLPSEQKALEDLLSIEGRHVLTLDYRKDVVSAWVPVNDVFSYASADADYIQPHQFAAYLFMVKRWGDDGRNAWVSHQRDNMQPVKELQSSLFKVALEYAKRLLPLPTGETVEWLQKK